MVINYSLFSVKDGSLSLASIRNLKHILNFGYTLVLTRGISSVFVGLSLKQKIGCMFSFKYWLRELYSNIDKVLNGPYSLFTCVKSSQ